MRYVLALGWASLFVTLVTPDDCIAAEEAKPVDHLIDRLADISEPGYGYSTLSAWSVFLPLPNTEEIGALVLGSPRPEHSDELEQIVRLGAAAVPPLLEHLNDRRPVKLVPIKGFDWMAFEEHYDRNQRVQQPFPEEQEVDLGPPEPYQLTVGDLCFVALGQIVNRQFAASRYQPTGGVVVASPTRSPRLREALRAEFRNFTEAKHRKFLRRDFESPDYEGRRIGAYRRLAFYYPAEVEPLVLKQLAIPVYDVVVIERFLREAVYPEPSPVRQKELVERFVAQHGRAYQEGIRLYLFEDLHLQEADEQGRLAPSPKVKRDARSVLIAAFDYSSTVTSEEKPYVDTWEAAERARFVQALLHDQSNQIDKVVLNLLQSAGTDDYLARACLARLEGRGYDDEIRRHRRPIEAQRGISE